MIEKNIKRIAMIGGVAADYTNVSGYVHDLGFKIENIHEQIHAQIELAGQHLSSVSEVNKYFDFGVFNVEDIDTFSTIFLEEALKDKNIYTVKFNLNNVRNYIYSSQDNFKRWYHYWCSKVADSLSQNLLSEDSQERPVCVEFPMLFEAGMAHTFDVIVFVDTPFRERIRRFCKEGFTEEEFWIREQIHFSENWKRSHADLVIPCTATRDSIPHYFEALVHKHQNKTHNQLHI